MEEDKFQFKTGGRTGGQTLYNAVNLLNYINELEPNKMYGIMKAGKGITLLTKSEVILVSKVKEKIEELKRTEELLSDEQGYWGGSDLLAKIEALQELLEKEQ